MKRISKSKIMILIVLFLCMGCSIFITYGKTKGLLRNEYENELRVESEVISGAIENSFLRPITVSETMSKDIMMYKMLNISSKKEAENVEEIASEYLSSIRDGFGYSMVFAVNDASKAYFTYDGISRYMSPDTDDLDSWYTSFMERDTDKPYLLDVDTDKVNDWALSVFVNTAVYNEDGEYIGVCGVGVDMTELQRMLERYERIYDVKINLIDSRGLIQVDTDASVIENSYVKIDNLESYSDGECYYEISKDISRTVSYIDDLEWYLVVQNNISLSSNVYSLFLPNIICMVIGIIIICVIFIKTKGRI